MSVRFLKKSWWVDFRFAGKRYRKRSPINTEQAARKHEILMRERMLRGEPAYVGHSNIPTFADFSDEWLVTYVDTHNKPSVQRTYRSILGVHLVPFFGTKRLAEIKSFDIEKYQGSKLREGLSAKSINSQLAVLMKCLRTAADWERLAAVPRAKPLKMVQPKFDFLTFEESDRLIAAAASEPHWHSMIVVALQTGLRIGELRALDWENVDLANGHITVCRSITDGIVSTPKNHKIRHVPLTEEVRAVLMPIVPSRIGVVG
jgi:integrase